MDKKEEEYRKLIDKCAENGADFTIQNSAPEHASYLIKTLFKKPDGQIMRIFTGRLHENVFADQELKTEAVNFLKRNSKNEIKIAYQDTHVEDKGILDGEFLRNIIGTEEIKGQIEVWDARSVFSSITNHFAVIDKAAFRYELDENTKKAVANFGDSANAENLVNIFENVIKKSKKVYPKN